MKTIKRRTYVFAALAIFSILTGVILFVLGETNAAFLVLLFPAVTIIAGIILTGFWLSELNKLKIARLIAENPILHICTAVISSTSAETAQPKVIEDAEVFISYFGILLGTKIIKFNQGGIRLKAVEITSDILSIIYGTEKQTQTIHLLHPQIDTATLEEIVQKFRFETGIIPEIPKTPGSEQ